VPEVGMTNAPAARGPRLVVVPSEPIAEYEAAGYTGLERYYNPGAMFAEVVALSPRERGQRRAHGLTIVGVPERDFGRVLRKVGPDAIRAYGGGWPADLVCRHRPAGTPVLVSVHNVHPLAASRAVRYADLVLCVSGAVERRVRSLGTPPSRLRRLPNRVDTEVFRPQPDPARQLALHARFPAGRWILHVGRRVEQKNLDTLIRALALLPQDYGAVFVGQGDREPYAALAEALGVGVRCVWVDAVANSELPLWYSWCDVMCTPSRWEGFGIVFIEAAACGAAIVTSDLAPMNEYLRHDESACLVADYENPGALAAAVRHVCEDDAYRRRLSAGAVKAAQPFDRRAVDAAEVAIYRETLALGAHVRDPLSASQRLDLAAWAAGAKTAGLAAALRRRLRQAVGGARS
jgi:glycosyltransferase involved in cell wall biosynthesis